MKWKLHESLSRIRASAKEEPRYFSTDLDYTTGLVGNCAVRVCHASERKNEKLVIIKQEVKDKKT